MKRLIITLEQTAGVIFPEHEATTGVAPRLPYVPGRQLMGWAAARLYRKLESQAATAFHSGRLRFGHGWPLTSTGQMTFPGPQCWFERKREKGGVENGRIMPENVRNSQHGLDFGVQPETLKGLMVATDGTVAEIKRGYSAMTAIRPGSRQKETSALFGFEYLALGHRFAALIEADDDLEQQIWQEVVACFAGEPMLRLGRSKKREFGGHFICRVVQEGKGIRVPWDEQVTQADDRALTLWCLSDLALIDPQTGMPTTAPDPQALGLPKGELVVEKSIISTKRVSFFNGYALCHEPEMLLIAAGSVLHFSFDAPVQKADLAPLATGVGLGREMGLGRVWINPPCLQDKLPGFATGEDAKKMKITIPDSETDRLVHDWPAAAGDGAPLAAWARRQLKEAETRQEREALARIWLKELRDILAAIDVMQLEQPSAAQWAEMRERCIQHESDAGKLRHALLGRNGYCRKGKEWTTEVPPKQGGNQPRSIKKWLESKLSERGARGDTGAILKQVANELMRTVK